LEASKVQKWKNYCRTDLSSRAFFFTLIEYSQILIRNEGHTHFTSTTGCVATSRCWNFN